MTRLPVAVLFEPVERRARGARGVEARRADDHELVGGVEHALRRRAEHSGGGVEADEVVVALEQPDRLADGRALERVCVRSARRRRSPRAGWTPARCTRERRRTCRSQPGRAGASRPSRRSRAGAGDPSVPASGFASSATTRSPRCEAKVWPTSRQVVVLPTPPLREMNATLRQPVIGVFTCATSSRRRSSAALGGIATAPPDAR